MSYSEIESKIKEILADQLNLDKSKIDLNSRLGEDLGMDSFSSIEIVFELEEEFGITISDEEIIKAKVVKDIVDYVVVQMEAKEKN